MLDANRRPDVEKQSNKSNKSNARGGARPGAGRKPGKLSAAKIELREMAKEHVPAMLKVLVGIASDGDSDSASYFANG